MIIDSYFDNIIKNETLFNEYVNQFKNFIYIDFLKVLAQEPFNPFSKWESGSYNINQKVYSEITYFVYKSLSNNNTATLDNTLYWEKQGLLFNEIAYFDIEIKKAMEEAVVVIGGVLMSVEKQVKDKIFFYLTAYLLTLNKGKKTFTATISQGIATSKSMGGASVSYQIPPTITNDADFWRFKDNVFGLQYFILRKKYVKFKAVNSYSGNSYSL